MAILSSVLHYILLCFSISVAYCLYKIFSYFNRVRILGEAVDKFPMEEKHWFWGHVHKFPGANEEGIKYWQSLIDRFPKCYGFWSLNKFKASIYVHHPDTIKTILKTAEPKSFHTGTYKYGQEWIGDGILLSSGEKWQMRRKLLTPAFHIDNLHQYMKVMNQCVDVFIEKLSKYANSRESIEITENLSALTLDIILRSTFSQENDIQKAGENHPYMKTIKELGDLWMKRSLLPWQHLDFIYNLSSDSRKFTKLSKYISSVSLDIINKRRAEYETIGENSPKQDNVLDILLKARDEDGNGLSDHDIIREVNTMLFVGHDTSAVAISWTLFSLAQHPQFQKQCQEEVDDMFAAKVDNDTVILSEDLNRLPFLTCCIKESMRMNAPVPVISRELTTPRKINGIMCPVGSHVLPMLFNLHHNGAVWPDHMKFDPERFFPENFEKMDPFAYAPFSAGPRNCLGQHFAMNEMKIFLSKVLHKYSFSLDPNHVTKRKFGLVTKTEDGMYLKVNKR